MHNKQQNAINVNVQVATICIDKYFNENWYKADSKIISVKEFHYCAHSYFYPASNSY